jgi:hypothetical protein
MHSALAARKKTEEQLVRVAAPGELRAYTVSEHARGADFRFAHDWPVLAHGAHDRSDHVLAGVHVRAILLRAFVALSAIWN